MVFIDNYRRLIFIENPNSGSEIIVKALELVLCKQRNKVERYLTCDEVKWRYPNEWSNYLVVGILCDEYDRYCCSVSNPKHYEGNYSNVKEFIRHRKRKDCIYCITQDEYIDGCDYIINVDTMQKDFDELCKRLGVQTIKLDRYNVEITRRFNEIYKLY